LDPEEFPGLRAAERESFNEVQSGTLEFALAWSRQDAKRVEDEYDASPSWRRDGGDGGQGCSTWAPKDEPSDDDDDDGGDEDYDIFYRRLGMN
jgi:hypothetical protein